MSTQILTVSSTGQIALPESMRRRLSISAGDKLSAYTAGDVILLKVIKLPTPEEFEKALHEAREWAASVGYSQEDVADIIRSVRRQAAQMKNRSPQPQPADLTAGQP